MNYTEYPQITESQYYIIATLCGLFILHAPLYSLVALLFLLYYGYSTHIARVWYILIACVIGIALFLTIYREKSIPQWYTSGETYLVQADIVSVHFDSNKKVRVYVRNITPLQNISIQQISKQKPCIVGEDGSILYTKARTCAVGYPLQSQQMLPEYGIYTITHGIPLLQEGQRIEGIFTIEDIRSNENGGFSLKEYYRQQHIRYRLRLREENTQKILGNATIFSDIGLFARNRFFEVITKIYGTEEERKQDSHINNDTIAIAYALLLGSRYYLSQELEKLFLSSGLLHSIVLSGLHVSSFLLFSLPLFFLCSRIIPYMVTYIPTRPIILFIMVLLSLFYAIVSSFPISYMRAICMLCIVLFLTLRYQRYTLLDVLLYTIFIILLFSPEMLFSLSLQLSCGAVFGIYFSLPFSAKYREYIYKTALPKYIQYILLLFGGIIITTVCINIVLLPLMLYSFGVLTYSIFLNLIWLPLLSFFVLPMLLIAFSLALCGIIIPILWYIALYPITVLLELLYFLKQFSWFDVIVGMRPHTLTILAFYLSLFSYILLANKRSAKKTIYIVVSFSFILLSVPIALRLYTKIDDRLHIEVLDVGKGQSILITYKDTRVLVDAGERSKYFDVGERVISPLLTYNSSPYLTHLILTHQDNDHIGGAVFLAKYYDIANIYYNGDDRKETKTVQDVYHYANKNNMKILKEGDNIIIDDNMRIDILLPYKQDMINKGIEKDSNARSIVLMVVYKGRNRVLLLGDIDIAGQKYLVEQYQHMLECEVIVLPHHGSRHNMYIPLYEKTKARYAFVSTGLINHNFVSLPMQEALQAHNIQLYTTLQHGKIHYSNNGEITNLSHQ